MRYFFEVAYRGTNYHGWQTQKNACSVQEKLEYALSIIFQKNMTIVGSGRTDTGVHALQQFFHMDIETPIHVASCIYKLNSVLPNDIVIKSICAVHEKAHARFSAISRSYEYRIVDEKNPFFTDLSCYFHKELHIGDMNEAAQLLVGKKDFQCFSKVKTDVNNFVCNITSAYWKEENNLLVFHISANRFLRNMVRSIVGTLIDVGIQKISINQLKNIIESKDRNKAGKSMPACGLFLTKVTYPEGIFM